MELECWSAEGCAASGESGDTNALEMVGASAAPSGEAGWLDGKLAAGAD